MKKLEKMGQPAARSGDMTSHRTVLSLTSGSKNVLIHGKAAWRAFIDKHECPLVNPGGVPHKGGVVINGSTTVLINGFPAVRKNDQIVESGPPNTICSGDKTVLIG